MQRHIWRELYWTKNRKNNSYWGICSNLMSILLPVFLSKTGQCTTKGELSSATSFWNSFAIQLLCFLQQKSSKVSKSPNPNRSLARKWRNNSSWVVPSSDWLAVGTQSLKKLKQMNEWGISCLPVNNKPCCDCHASNMDLSGLNMDI